MDIKVEAQHQSQPNTPFCSGTEPTGPCYLRIIGSRRVFRATPCRRRDAITNQPLSGERTFGLTVEAGSNPAIGDELEFMHGFRPLVVADGGAYRVHLNELATPLSSRGGASIPIPRNEGEAVRWLVNHLRNSPGSVIELQGEVYENLEGVDRIERNSRLVIG